MQEIRDNTSVYPYSNLPNESIWPYLAVPAYLMVLSSMSLLLILFVKSIRENVIIMILWFLNIRHSGTLFGMWFLTSAQQMFLFTLPAKG
jgi:hypothetical protein